MANKNLHDAKVAKKDEFYTRIEDIANELKHYRDFFRGKSVLCNCDDPYESNFFKFFPSTSTLGSPEARGNLLRRLARGGAGTLTLR